MSDHICASLPPPSIAIGGVATSSTEPRCMRCNKANDAYMITYRIRRPGSASTAAAGYYYSNLTGEINREAHFCQECWFAGQVHAIMSMPMPPVQQLDE